MKFLKILFQGRINRFTYLTGIVLITFLAIVGGLLLGKLLAYPLPMVYLLFSLILYYIFCSFYYYSLIVRRRQDINKNPEDGVPYPVDIRHNYGGGAIIYYLVWLFFLNGEPKDNQYGRLPSKGIDFYALVLGNKKAT